MNKQKTWRLSMFEDWESEKAQEGSTEAGKKKGALIFGCFVIFH